MNESTSSQLRRTIQQRQYAFPEDRIDLLARYCDVLWGWNEKLNLTRHTDVETFVDRDLLDTTRLADLLEEEELVLDVGSGGGIPGILLGIMRPDLRVALAESVGKKAEVLNDMVQELELEITVFHARAEDVVGDIRFDTLTARAVGPLWKICTWFEGHWEHFGRLLAIKGPRWVEERGEARHRGLLKNVELRKTVVYSMPGTEAESVILKLWHKGDPEPGEP